MRVAIVGSYPLDSGRIEGGVQAAFVYLVKGLCKIQDLQVHVLTFGRRDRSGPDQVEQDGVTLHLLPPFPRFERLRNYSTYQATLNRKLAQVRPHVLHAQDTTAHAYVATRSGYPAVVTVHGVRYEDGKHYGSLGRRLRNYFDSLLIERYVMRHTRHLIAISRYVTDYFGPQLRSDIQVYYVPNAIHENFFSLADTSDGQTVLFAGRVMPRKRVLDLVQAFAQVVQQVPSAQLRIAGEYRTEVDYVKAVRDFIQAAGLGDNVHLLGSLDEEAILREFAGCNVLALPSIQETTPMVIAQAMAARKPVVATPVGGVAEMVTQGQTGFLVEVGDVDGLAEALLSLLRDSTLRRRMGEAGREFALENYHADAVARCTYAAYQSVVAGGGGEADLLRRVV